LIDIDGIREIWIKGHYRALIMPVKGTNIAIVSLDIFSNKWKFKIEEEAKIDNTSLVYARFSPEELGIKSVNNPVEKIELIGALGENFAQTISARLWVKLVDAEKLKCDIENIHNKLMEIIK